MSWQVEVKKQCTGCTQKYEYNVTVHRVGSNKIKDDEKSVTECTSAGKNRENSTAVVLRIN